METDYESPPPSNNPILGGVGEGEEGFTKKNKKKIQHKRVYGKRGKRAILRVAAQRIEGSTSESEEIKEKEKSSQASTRESKKGKERKGKEKEEIVEISSQSSGRKGEEVRGTLKSGKQTTKLPRITTKPSILSGRLEKILSSSGTRQTSQSSATQVASSFNNPQPVASTSKLPYSNSNVSNQTIVQSSRVRSQSLTSTRQQQENLHSEVVLQRRSSLSRSKEKNKAFPILPSSTNPVEIYSATTITSPRHLLRSRLNTALADKSNLPTTTTTDSPKLTDLPPTLPLFKRQYSTRLSLSFSSSSSTKTPTYLLDNNPEPPTSSSSNLKIFKDSSSSSSSNPLPLPPPPPPPSSSDLINHSNPPPLLPPTLTSSFSSSSRSHIITSPHRRTSLIPPLPPPRSPSTPAAAPPKFKFTTTIFDNSTSFDRFTEPSLHPHHHHHHHRHEFNLEGKGGGRILGIGIGIEDVVIEGKEGDGMGMESDFVLESFLESDSQIVAGGEREDSRIDPERSCKGREKEVTIQVEGRDRERERELRKIQVEENELVHNEVGDIVVEKGDISEKTIEMEKGIEDQFGDESKSTIRNEISEEQEITLEELEREEGLKLIPSQSAEKEEKEAGAGHLEKAQVETVEEKEEVEKAQSYEFDPPPLEEYSTVEPPIRAEESDGASVPSPVLEPIYDACHLPPRRPRVQISSPTPASASKPASDEDDLAFLIRTTATHSSEDDLPRIDPDLSSDEKDFQSAEREIGRGIKSTSGQRGKRIELKEKMRNGGGGGYLRIGEGKGGRRLKWKREIVDLERETVDDDVGEEGDDELELKVEEEWREEGGW